LCPRYQILGISPALEVSKVRGGGVHGDTLWRHPLLEGVVEESPMTRALLPLAGWPLDRWHHYYVVPIVSHGSCPATGGVPCCACVCVCPCSPRSILRSLTLPQSFGFHSRCFVAESAMAVSLWRMLCHRYLFGPLLVDALLLRACWPTAWRILGRRGHLVFIGGCFATVFVGCSSIFSRWMLCHYCIFRFVGNHCVDVSFSCHVRLVGFWVEG
jgi:hypothetical protein